MGTIMSTLCKYINQTISLLIPCESLTDGSWTINWPPIKAALRKKEFWESCSLVLLIGGTFGLMYCMYLDDRRQKEWLKDFEEKRRKRQEEHKKRMEAHEKWMKEFEEE